MAKEVSPTDWRYVFEQTPGGREVLDQLVKQFGRSVFVKGGLEGDRETAFRAGQRSVLDYILTQINIANGVQDNPNE